MSNGFGFGQPNRAPGQRISTMLSELNRQRRENRLLGISALRDQADRENAATVLGDFSKFMGGEPSAQEILTKLPEFGKSLAGTSGPAAQDAAGFINESLNRRIQLQGLEQQVKQPKPPKPRETEFREMFDEGGQPVTVQVKGTPTRKIKTQLHYKDTGKPVVPAQFGTKEGGTVRAPPKPPSKTKITTLDAKKRGIETRLGLRFPDVSLDKLLAGDSEEFKKVETTEEEKLSPIEQQMREMVLRKLAAEGRELPEGSSKPGRNIDKEVLQWLGLVTQIETEMTAGGVAFTPAKILAGEKELPEENDPLGIR